MACYQVRLTRNAAKQLAKMDPAIQAFILRWIEKNLKNTSAPRSHGKPLVGDRSGEWRYRAGNYRIICEIRDEELLILAISIGHRKNIY